MVKEGLLEKYTDKIATGKLVTRDTAKNALGAEVSGYVMPMFHSQTAIAYNPDLVKDPPTSYAELVEWAKKNPKQFGYNGIKGGMSGVAFVSGWVYAFGGDADKLIEGPLRRRDQGGLGQVARRPQGVQQERRHHARQRRHARHAEPRRDRHGPGLGRHVLHLGGRRQAAAEHAPEAGRARHARPADVLRDPRQGERQARGGVHRARDEPRGAGRGHRQAVQLVSRASTPSTSRASSTRRPGRSCSPTSRRRTSSTKGKPFPIGPYFNDILEAYEQKVAN